MLLTRERVRPCRARFSRSSSGRVTTRVSPSCWIVIVSGARCSRGPLGPCTTTCRPESVTSTPDGMVMGSLPTRDMTAPLPDLAEDLAADVALARLAVGHQPLVGRQDGDAHAAQHTREPVGGGVHA